MKKIASVISLLSAMIISSNAYSQVSSFKCITYKKFGYVSTPTFYFYVHSDSPTNVTGGMIQVPSQTGGAAKDIVIELTDQDDSYAYFSYNNVSATYTKATKTTIFTAPLSSGVNQIYAGCN